MKPISGLNVFIEKNRQNHDKILAVFIINSLTGSKIDKNQAQFGFLRLWWICNIGGLGKDFADIIKEMNDSKYDRKTGEVRK